ncbi:hypothetical protein EYF80_016248 [Liparis tanakae]|uniref:Uncharacterized protein n=1 Tax=Liparis tanakae TaxID=230148 RepID=A0A4Z2I692_9TELE|nr:hypothetical protein EYF80_016248 [Liparis tanakae]
MLVTVEANNWARQSCNLISKKPEASATAECRAAHGPISARMHTAGEPPVRYPEIAHLHRAHILSLYSHDLIFSLHFHGTRRSTQDQQQH